MSNSWRSSPIHGISHRSLLCKGTYEQLRRGLNYTMNIWKTLSMYQELRKFFFFFCVYSPADTQVDLEVGFKLFFFTDSCSPDLAGQESDWCHIGIIEHFEIFKMAAKMVAKYTFSLFCYSSGFKTYFLHYILM